MKNRGALHACHIPDWRDPYQRHLLASLQRLGVRAEWGIAVTRLGIDVTLLEGYLRGRIRQILHLHWQHPFLLGESSLASRLKSAFFLAQVALLKMLGIRLVWTIHNLHNHENRFVDLEHRSCARLASAADRIIVHCEEARRQVIERYRIADGGKVRIVPHGAWPYEPTADGGPAARSRLGLESHSFVFLFLGLIRPYKGLEDLLAAFSSITHDEAVLFIAGRCVDPTLEKTVRRAADGARVKVRLEWIADADVPRLMEAADVMVCPYRNILTSGSVITGMSHAKPVIAPRIGCIAEMLPEGGGFLYDPQEQAGLIHALRRALATPRENLRSMGALNRSVCDRLAWEPIARRVVTIYEE